MLDRRDFLRGTLAAGALAACGSSGASSDGSTDNIVPGPDAMLAPPDAAPVETCDPDPLAGGTLVGSVPILDSGSPSYGRLYPAGLDARLYTDLSLLQPDALVTPAGLYFVRTEPPDGPMPAKLTIDGLVDAPLDIGADELIAAARDQGTYVMECSGNSTHVAFALISAGAWRGVKVGDVLDRVRPLPGAARILFSG